MSTASASLVRAWRAGDVREVVIVEGVRTPIGRFEGALAGVRSDCLGAIVLNELLRRTGLSAQQVDDVVFGCVTQVGEQSANVARTALLSAGWPTSVPGMTVDRKCGSGEAAIHVAAGAIAAGACETVVAGGVESMSRVQLGGNRAIHGPAFGTGYLSRYEAVGQGEAAERVAERWQLDRGALDSYALESHRRAARAVEAGRFEREIVPVALAEWSEQAPPDAAAGTVVADQGVRPNSSLEKLASLKPAFRPDGRITAGNSSQISDGAAALLLMSADAASRLGLTPRAKIRAMTVVGSDPTIMLTGPIEATRKVLARAGMAPADIDLFEVNEAFAPVPLMWSREIDVEPDRINVNGGAIALGHPLGASGARLMTTLLHELERRDAALGLQTMCCAGGLGTATVIERLG
jgi:acetyl-CoA acyltransferase